MYSELTEKLLSINKIQYLQYLEFSQLSLISALYHSHLLETGCLENALTACPTHDSNLINLIKKPYTISESMANGNRLGPSSQILFGKNKSFIKYLNEVHYPIAQIHDAVSPELARKIPDKIHKLGDFQGVYSGATTELTVIKTLSESKLNFAISSHSYQNVNNFVILFAENSPQLNRKFFSIDGLVSLHLQDIMHYNMEALRKNFTPASHIDGAYI